MFGLPEFFESPETGIRIMLTESAAPRNSGEVHLFTPEVGKWRPLLSPEVHSFNKNAHSWRVTVQDPAMDNHCVVQRVSYRQMKVGDGPLLQRASSSDALADKKYLVDCQFVLFHGQVEEGPPLTVICGVNWQGPWATFSGLTVPAATRSRREDTGGLNFGFPGIGALYLPSPYAVAIDPERIPCLDHHYLTPAPYTQADLAQLPNPPLTWDLIE